MNGSAAVALEPARNAGGNVRDEKMVDRYPSEDTRYVRIHKQQDCFYCGAAWYLSDGKLLFHQRKQVEDLTWKFPTSCPGCRNRSKTDATQAHKSRCVSGKQEFDSAQKAETYNREVLEKRGFVSQRPYQCPDCHLFHLTSQPVEVSSGTLASPLGKVAVRAKPVRQHGESRAEIARLLALGRSPAEIAAELKMGLTNVYHHKRALKMPAMPATPASPAATAVVGSRVRVLDERDLDAVEEDLQRQLEEVQRRKSMIAEARMLRVELVSGAIRIVKEGEHMLLPFEERDKLVSLLSLLTMVGRTEAIGCEAVRRSVEAMGGRKKRSRRFGKESLRS
jgi:hypothetical protein